VLSSVGAFKEVFGTSQDDRREKEGPLLPPGQPPGRGHR